MKRKSSSRSNSLTKRKKSEGSKNRQCDSSSPSKSLRSLSKSPTSKFDVFNRLYDNAKDVNFKKDFQRELESIIEDTNHAKKKALPKSANIQSRLFQYLTKQPEPAKNYLKVGDEENCIFQPQINPKSIKIDQKRQRAV